MSDVIKREAPGRLLHLDILRVLAIFLVIFNHTGDRGYMLFVSEADSFLYFPYMMASVFCKIAVPIFFMISGALLLPREESLKQLFAKRVLRMAVVLILVSVPYYVWLHRSQGIGIGRFFTYIYGSSASTSLWYLYSYIGLLLLLPFLRSMVRGMKQKDFIYLLIGHVVLVGVLPCLEYCLWGGSVTLNEAFSSVIFVSQNVFFALMGYYLEHVPDEKCCRKKTVAAAILFSIAAMVITCLMTYVQSVKTGVCSTAQQEVFFNSFICIPAMTVYFAVKSLCSSYRGQGAEKVMSVLGAAVFGVYLIEKIIRTLTDGVYTLLSPIIGSFAASLVWCLVVCCVGFAIIIPLKHIPGVKKLVNRLI